MRAVVLAIAAAAGFVGPAAAGRVARPQNHESRHYRLEVNGDIGDPQDYLKMAEALYERLARYHGKTPPLRRKLEVRFWRTKKDYLAGATADGIPASVLNAGGYYAPSTKRAYFWRQPNLYSTRHLFLHELTHQFQYNSVLGGSRRRGQAWYIEGIAEYFAYHRWDGETLHVGESDIICLEKRLANVVQRARDGTLDLAAVIEGRGKFDRGDYWGVIHFLSHGADPRTQRQWKLLERKLWKGGGNAVVAKELLGGRRGALLTQAARDYIATVPYTWHIDWINWYMHGDAIRGWSKSQALLRSRARYRDHAWIECTVHPGSGRVVVAVGKRKRTDFVGLAIEANGKARFVGRASGGGWATDPSRPVRVRLEAKADGSVKAWLDGKLVGDTRVSGNPAEGYLGLLVGNGDRRFADWKVAAPPKQ